MAREDPQQHDSVVADLDHLRNAGLGVVVTDDEITALLQLDSRRDVSDVGVGEATRIDTVEINPTDPSWAGAHQPWTRSLGLAQFPRGGAKHHPARRDSVA
jgi:hypothetical protein